MLALIGTNYMTEPLQVKKVIEVPSWLALVMFWKSFDIFVNSNVFTPYPDINLLKYHETLPPIHKKRMVALVETFIADFFNFMHVLMWWPQLYDVFYVVATAFCIFHMVVPSLCSGAGIGIKSGMFSYLFSHI